MDANFGFRKTSLTFERKVSCWFSEGGSAMSLSAKHLMFGAALVLSGSPLFAAETAANAVVAASPRAYVNCPGISNVPMTADPEQALPLRQTAILACGQQVAVLADNEGYTTQIRTSDGKVGYVPPMYLTTAAPASQQELENPAPASNATPVNAIIRWTAVAHGYDHFTNPGAKVKS